MRVRVRVWQGVSVGEKLVNMGQRCSDTRPLFFDNVVVPAENGALSWSVKG